MHWQRARADGSLALAPRQRRERGTGSLSINGYYNLADRGRRLGQHVFVAERALGKRLPPGAVVHHVDHNRANNEPTNLVVCPDSAYHNLIHLREAALDACGHADWRSCTVCKEWDDPVNLKFMSNGNRPSPKVAHAGCYNNMRQVYRAAKKAA